MSLKGLIKKIATPLVLAGSLVLGNFDSKLARSQDEEEYEGMSPSELRGYGSAFRSFGFLYDSGILPADSLSDLKFYRGMSVFNHFMSDYSYGQAQSLDNKLLRDAIRDRKMRSELKQVDINQIPQTYIANYWKDFNGDNIGRIDEFVGLNKPVFNSNESFIFGMYLPLKKIKGKGFNMEVSDPNGKSVFIDSGFLERDMYVESAYLNLDVVSKKHGPGTYATSFYLDGKHWETRQFGLIAGEKTQESEEKFPETYLCHWCEEEDLDKDNLADFNEMKKFNEKIFNEGERISFGIRARDRSKELLEVKVFSKNNDEGVYSVNNVNETTGMLFHKDDLKPGKYYVVFKRDGKYVDDIEFEVVPNPEKSLPPEPRPAQPNPAPAPAPTPEPISSPQSKNKTKQPTNKPQKNKDITFKEVPQK